MAPEDCRTLRLGSGTPEAAVISSSPKKNAYAADGWSRRSAVIADVRRMAPATDRCKCQRFAAFLKDQGLIKSTPPVANDAVEFGR
jgi:hypothetical protein